MGMTESERNAMFDTCFEYDDRLRASRHWAGEEDMEYARRLVHAGVATELLVVRGAFHGFDLLVPDAAVSQQFSASWKSALRKAFATGKADIAEKPKASGQR